MRCRSCGSESLEPFIDLGSAPLSNGYLTTESLHHAESWLPLRVLVCTECWLAQTEDYLSGEEIFTDDYAYFSSTSSSWLDHARQYVAAMTNRFDLGPSSMVIEVAANDGYLLRFVRDRGIPCLGIEPTASTATAGRGLGLMMIEEFVGLDTGTAIADKFGAADLVVGNNVLAHVPDVADFVSGLRALMKPDGVLSVEFPRLTSMISGAQFDTIYHEHYSYLSLHAVQTIFAREGLVVFDVEEIATHGGSLRVLAQRKETGAHKRELSVDRILSFERAQGVTSLSYYSQLQSRAEAIKNGLLEFLLEVKADGKSVAAYGAAAKGNTLLNFAGVRPDLLPFVVDRSDSKIGRFMPGSRIPIVAEGALRETRPDYVLILPWNIASEVTAQLSYARSWGAKFVAAVPEMARW